MPDDLFTTDEALTDPADQHGSTGLTADELRALDGLHTHLDRVNAREAYGRPAGQPRNAPEDATYLRRIADRIEPWHSIATPPAVVAAREALDAAIEADQAARQEWADLPAREAAERDAIGAAAVAGEPLPAVTDWGTARVVALAVIAERARETKAAARAYDEVVRKSLSAWRDALVSAVEPARQEALSQFQGVEAAVSRWQAAIEAAHAVDAALHPGDELQRAPVPGDVAQVVARGKGAARALGEFLRSEHPAVSGAYLQRKDSLRPTRSQRAAMAEGNAAAWSQLMAIEIAEGFRFTDYTREEAQRFAPNAQGELRPRDPRSSLNGWDEGVAFLSDH